MNDLLSPAVTMFPAGSQGNAAKDHARVLATSRHWLMLIVLVNLALQTAWARFGEFMKERAELANRDWLSVRDEAWRVEDFLNKWAKTTEGNVGTDPVALILAKEIDSYRQVAQ